MNTATQTPRIYVASLSDYNAGILHGVWIDATQDPEDIQYDIDVMLAESPTAKAEGVPAEEYAVHDWEGFHGCFGSSEWPDLEAVSTVANLLVEYGEPFAVWFGAEKYAFHDWESSSDEWADQFADQFRGEWESLADYAEELLDGTGQLTALPRRLYSYFNFEAYGRDLNLSGDVWVHEAGYRSVYIFDNH